MPTIREKPPKRDITNDLFTLLFFVTLAGVVIGTMTFGYNCSCQAPNLSCAPPLERAL